MQSGIIFNIERYSIHDGPGIRTTVFLKGCPLNCLWCHNPESQSFSKEIIFNKNRCISCGACISYCKNEAIIIENNEYIYLRDNCLSCGECTSICYAEARNLSGKEISIEELIKEIEKDIIFFDDSGGGVTFSGGEPLLQSEFLFCALIECKERRIHTAIDTSGFVKSEILLKISPLVNLFLYDLKIFDEDKHIQYTGVSNKIILDNLNKLSQIHNNIVIRFPVIPGINTNENEISAMSDYMKNHNLHQINILPYHKIGIDKYFRINKKYKLMDIQSPNEEELNKIKNIFTANGINVKVGG